MHEQERQRVRRDFDDAVNMTADRLERWLDTDRSKSVGDRSRGDSDESVGHASGRRIVSLLGKRRGDLTDDDYRHMRTVVGYVHRHLAQRPDRPDRDIEDSRWRRSLMNWGHDPLG